jgi:hypothetical protein
LVFVESNNKLAAPSFAVFKGWDFCEADIELVLLPSGKESSVEIKSKAQVVESCASHPFQNRERMGQPVSRRGQENSKTQGWASPRLCVVAPRHTRFPFLSLKSYSDLFRMQGSGHPHGVVVESKLPWVSYALVVMCPADR